MNLSLQVNQKLFHKEINKLILSGLPVIFYLFFCKFCPNHLWSCGQNKVHLISTKKQRPKMKPNSCPSKGNNPTALSAWLFPSICFTAHNHKTLNRPFSAVLTDSVLIKTSLHMLRQLPRPITNDQLIIIAPLFLFFPPTSSPQTNLGHIPSRCLHIRCLLCFRLKTASEDVFPKH